jgi:asparagine synthase (glutamine-hydrolysing)
MPGITGLVGPESDAELLPRMLKRMQHHPWYTRDAWTNEDGTAALGRVALGYVNTAPQPAADEDGTRAVLEGEIYDYAALRKELEAKGCAFRTDGHAELLLHGWTRDGADFVRRLNGCFAAAIWDAGTKTLTLLNDRFGMRPLYYSHAPGKLLFGSELKTLLADPDLSRAADPRGLAEFFTFGQYLGDTTSFAAISLLPAAGVLTYHVADDRVELSQYAKLGENWRGVSTGNPTDALDRIDEAFARSVARCTNGTANLGLALSGGLDARTILGVIDPAQPVTTVCLGMEGSIDVKCATEMARLTNRKHHTHTLGTQFLADFHRHMHHMVQLTDGQYLCQCIVMPTLPLYRELGIEVLVRGHAGELMHMTKAYNFSLDAETLNLTNAGLDDWLWRRLQAHMLDGVEGPLFTPAFGTDLAEQARSSLRRSTKESDGILPPAHRIWHLFVAERIRRETGLSMTEFGSVVETRVPYLDADLIDALMSAPPELKLAETIQSHILRKRQPSFLNVVNANTGARLDAGPMAKGLAKLKLKVFAKLGVKGYQPYERLGLWLRRELRPTVEGLLLDDRCLSRGVFNPETVRSAVANHLANRRNHTFLLMAMMIFELGQREFVDGDAYAEVRSTMSS